MPCKLIARDQPLPDQFSNLGRDEALSSVRRQGVAFHRIGPAGIERIDTGRLDHASVDRLREAAQDEASTDLAKALLVENPR